MGQESQNERRPGPTGIPVEPLSDLSWQRIERRLFAGGAIGVDQASDGGDAVGAWKDRGRLIAGALGAAALVAVAALGLLMWPRGVAREGAGSSVVAEAPHAVRPSSRIETDDAPSTVTEGDVSLELAAHTKLLVDHDSAGGVLVVLEKGELTCQVAPRDRRPPVVVQAGDARVEVIGTRFAVSRIDESARVEVYEGIVAVMQHGQRTQVGAGEKWSGAPEAPVAAPPAKPVRERERARPRPEPKPGRPSGRGGRASAGDPASSARTVGDEVSDKARYDHAAGLEASDPDAALAIYDRLANEGGPWAAIALYAQGRLELDRGHRRSARALLEVYLGRYPRGANAEDARQLLRQLR